MYALSPRLDFDHALDFEEKIKGLIFFYLCSCQKRRMLKKSGSRQNSFFSQYSPKN